MARLGSQLASWVWLLAAISLTLLLLDARITPELAAEATLRRAVGDAEAALRPDAAEFAVVLNELGIVAKYSGDFAGAEAAFQRALAIEERRNRARGVAAANILHNLAGLAHARGDAAAALPLALRGIDIRASSPDVDRQELIQDEAALAAILVDLDRYDEARATLSRVLRNRPARYDAAVALHNLGSLRFRQGDIIGAITTLWRAQALKTAELGRRHPDLAPTLHNLACCFEQLGWTRWQRRYLRRAVAVLESTVTADHPTLLACRRKLTAAEM